MFTIVKIELFTFVNMSKEIKSIPQLWEAYPSFKNVSFAGRYLSQKKIEKGLAALSPFFQVATEGYSVQNRPISSVHFGSGKIKVLMWSQMHGNETTTTKAVFDLLHTFENNREQVLFREITDTCTFKIIPVLNPDAAVAYTRENANNMDLNRDALNMTQPESRLLDRVFKEFQPDFCFNLHDQRSIYGVGRTNRPAIVSFLSPSMNKQKEITASREISMKLIADINRFLQQLIPGQIGRYDDGFNPNCVGDKFQSLQVPTLLFEAGHFPGDYQREETRKLIYIALFQALKSICDKRYQKTSLQEYDEIPENEKTFFDILVRNIIFEEKIQDVGIQYKECLKEGEIHFPPFVEELGDLSKNHGHKEINGKGLQIASNSDQPLQKGMLLDELKFGGKNITLKLTKN